MSPELTIIILAAILINVYILYIMINAPIVSEKKVELSQDNNDQFSNLN